MDGRMTNDNNAKDAVQHSCSAPKTTKPGYWISRSFEVINVSLGACRESSGCDD